VKAGLKDVVESDPSATFSVFFKYAGNGYVGEASNITSSAAVGNTGVHINGSAGFNDERIAEMDPVDNMQVQGTRNHVDAQISATGAGAKVDNRGKHWKSKVDEGCPPTPWKGNQFWSALKNEMERQFNPAVLPWNFENQRKTGSASKVIFMQLLLNRGARIVQVIEGEGFYGISEFLVPALHRSAFDEGAVPSADSQHGEARKRFSKIWETAGFREQRLGDGGLKYVYDDALFLKQKAQQK
jgi:hypothetical protein